MTWLRRFGIRASTIGMALALIGACTSTVEPSPTATSPDQSRDPAATSTSVAPPPTGSVIPPSLPPPALMPMPGFAGVREVILHGNEWRAEVFSVLSCDALAGWFQAGDWRLDGEARPPSLSESPLPSGVKAPELRMIALSHGDDTMLVRLGSYEGDAGCRALVLRLSTQTMRADGAFSADTSAMALQATCVANLQTLRAVQLRTFYFADDGPDAQMAVELPLVLGSSPITEAEVRIGDTDLTPVEFAAISMGSVEASQGLEDQLMTFEGPNSEEEVQLGTATVTSIDPLVATVDLAGLTDETGRTLSFSATTRCDLAPGALTEAAAVATPSPSPTLAPVPVSRIEVTLGEGADAFSQVIENEYPFCEYGITAPDQWALAYDGDPGDAGVTYIRLRAGGSAEPLLDVEVNGASYRLTPAQGDLSASADDQGDMVNFIADGNTPDGRVHLEATCRAVGR